ncbi:MAG: M23 family metallopeptidase [Deltaproteobacteria bacterium]|nr:M23 family metallopeptidase [Deltaproteobacteria bacterium]
MLRAATGLVLGVFCLGLPGSALARTVPSGGAAAVPPTAVLRAPFPCGVTFKAACGYGPGCSSFHHNTTAPKNSNDYYALDLTRAEANNGYDLPITAVAAGSVIYAGWATGGWVSYGQIVVLEHTFDGAAYQTLYAHMNRVLVQVGQRVAAGDTVGTMGGSSNGSLRGTSYHLHFAMYRGAKVDGGPYGGVAVVPEALGGAEDLATGKVMTDQCQGITPPPPKDAGGAAADAGAPVITGDAGQAPPPKLDVGAMGPGQPGVSIAHPDGGDALTVSLERPRLFGGCAVGGRDGWRAFGLGGLVTLLALVGGLVARRGRRRPGRQPATDPRRSRDARGL